MNTKPVLSILITLLLTSASLLSACAPSAASAPSDPLTIVQLYYDALQAKDLDKAMTYAADNVIASDATGYYYGKEEVTAAIKRGWAAGDVIEESDFKAAGNRVTSCYKYYQNETLVDQNCNAVTHVRDGKIIFDGLQPNESLFVVQEFYEALNAKDVDTAMTWVAPDALFANPTGKFEGQDAIRASLESQARDGITFELSKFHMIGTRVSYDYKVMSGSEQLESGTNGLTIVKDGKVVFDGTQETAP